MRALNAKECSALVGGLLSLQLIAAPTTAASAAPGAYSVIRQVPGPDGRWDYASVSSETHRLFLAQGGVTTLDLTTEKVLPRTIKGQTTHAVLYLANQSQLVLSDGAGRVVQVFDAASGALQGEISTASTGAEKGTHNPDALVMDPQSGYVMAVNADSGDVLVIDTKERETKAVIHVGGHLEFAAADKAGHLYVNVASSNAIAVVDIGKRKVTQTYALQGCEEPTGLAYVESEQLLISACSNGVAKFMAADSGREIASLKVARGADAVIYDSIRHRAFIPGGDDGTLTVISVGTGENIAIVQTLATQKGPRLGSVDEATGLVYLPTASFGPPVPPVPFPSVIPGTFKILVVGPK
jgi:DNA-binding beta-propeller fold protein YncE